MKKFCRGSGIFFIVTSCVWFLYDAGIGVAFMWQNGYQGTVIAFAWVLGLPVLAVGYIVTTWHSPSELLLAVPIALAVVLFRAGRR